MRIVVSGSFTATHSCVEGHPHDHKWHVTAWFVSAPRADARLFRESLDTMLARWEGRVLPAGRDWNEDIAEEISGLVNCVEVRVWREADRLGAHWIA
jgi:hypothetical protein